MSVSPTFVRSAAAAPGEAGAYALLIALQSPLDVKAGAKKALLPPALYLYCGSARGPGGLTARIARHMRQEKRAHWHVDQLTCNGKVLGAFVFPGCDECAINAALVRLPTPVDGFGSSDCRRCRSHLRLWTSGLQLPREFKVRRREQRAYTSLRLSADELPALARALRKGRASAVSERPSFGESPLQQP